MSQSKETTLAVSEVAANYGLGLVVIPILVSLAIATWLVVHYLRHKEVPDIETVLDWFTANRRAMICLYLMLAMMIGNVLTFRLSLDLW